ncbi:MAG: YkvA family protein [Acutalibacteraceae bacterium]
MNLKKSAENLKTDVPAVFLALKDKRTPVLAKIFAALTVAYALSPVDLVPDFIPVLGYLDDVILLPALVALTVRFIPKEIMESCLEKAKELWKDGKPKKWYYALPVVLFWLAVVMLIVKLIFSKH